MLSGLITVIILRRETTLTTSDIASFTPTNTVIVLSRIFIGFYSFGVRIVLINKHVLFIQRPRPLSADRAGEALKIQLRARFVDLYVYSEREHHA